MRYEEMDQHLVEGMEFSRRTIPDGIFDRWIRTARSEFLMVSARWEEADQVLSGLDASSSEAYLNSEILSMRGLLYAYRGRFDEAAEMTAEIADTALRIGDLQAVIPVLASQFAVRVGMEDDAGAVESLRAIIERRGDISETFLSAWFAFEAADGLTTIFVRDPNSTALRQG